jgi:hypothetical protein
MDVDPIVVHIALDGDRRALCGKFLYPWDRVCPLHAVESEVDHGSGSEEPCEDCLTMAGAIDAG